VIARALKPHGGIVSIGRLYTTITSTGKILRVTARSCVRYFPSPRWQVRRQRHHSDQTWAIDFQVPQTCFSLFAGLQRTNVAMELQITQEYTGQQRHLCFLPSMWKEVLDFDMHLNQDGTLVKDLASGKTFRRPAGGFVGVANVGGDVNWIGHPLAMANLYGLAAWRGIPILVREPSLRNGRG